ncbi:unnamed protein product [Rotaria magnacalcarata]|uniref:Cordon-bleu ubiquitin-like domain-containing protein n=1 Tax=Rotaria magnacalcarata TaxID=392030 RepID=A0A815AHU2_9BILA|nr:unnamed protein product [Rotaria magnacalcarata]
MPILEQAAVTHHHHGHGHQAFYHEQHISESSNKIELTLILPNGVPSVLNVDPNTPMMDLLVQAASLNKLNPSSYTLVALDSNQHVIHFKANQTVGQIVKNCRLPQINGSSTISLHPKESAHSNSSSKIKTQPFEITVRLLVNLPDAQKILLRIDPTLSLQEIKEQICKQKKYTNSNEYTLRLPSKLDEPVSLGLSLAEYKTNELTLLHQKPYDLDQQLNTNPLQSFDRLYRLRSESQPRKENSQQNEQQPITITHIHHTNSSRSSSLRPSHTTLHAYWNDPNFDTQSQLSTSSSIAKKRRAPRPPGCTKSTRPESQIIYAQHQLSNDIPSPQLPLRSDHHHQSHESLQSENTKKKRKAPVVAPTNGIHKKDESDKLEQQHQTNHITRPGLDPPPPPPLKSIANTIPTSANNLNEDFHSIIETNRNSIDESSEEIHSKVNEPIFNSLENRTTTNDKLNITTDSLELTNIEIHSPSSIHSLDQLQTDSPNSTLTDIQQQSEEKFEQKEIAINVIDSPIPKPSRQNFHKEKKTSTNNGLLRIINDHNERSNIYQKVDIKPKETNENVSYFRVAKSRYGKFETENRNFVHNSIAIFDSTNQQKVEKQIQKGANSSELSNSKQSKAIQPNIVQHQTKGKQAYSLLKKYEKEEQLKSTNDTGYLKTTNQQEKTSTPKQLELTERITHISVTLENGRKQLITRAASTSRPPSPPPAPPILAPKPFGKIITEYRTVRPMDNNDEIITRKHNGSASSIDMNHKRLSPDLSESHDALMASIRKFGGSQNLRKN